MVARARVVFTFVDLGLLEDLRERRAGAPVVDHVHEVRSELSAVVVAAEGGHLCRLGDIGDFDEVSLKTEVKAIQCH